MVSIDGSLFIQIANFLILIWILNTILYKPIRNVLRQRKEKVTGLERDIDLSQKDAKEKSDAFSSGMKAARAKGLKEKDVMVQAAENEEKEIVGKINEKAAAELAKVREKIAKDAEGVRNSLVKEIDTFARDIGKKILGRAV
ncbi:ATP synthase F0 subunit B [Desulfonema magnum]|uniref:ATP synthase subunit b n=1 Tax=Desulfonema magnum TaxID=45655 RepID=A0A975GTP6_9BACT|nr:ATP synthase F0 subunit B [Desulfonema magnum]QTA93207.1 ATP synthase, subunit beta (ATP synthase F0 sector subunit b) [Desulfonema magnum]